MCKEKGDSSWWSHTWSALGRRRHRAEQTPGLFLAVIRHKYQYIKHQVEQATCSTREIMRCAGPSEKGGSSFSTVGWGKRNQGSICYLEGVAFELCFERCGEYTYTAQILAHRNPQ